MTYSENNNIKMGIRDSIPIGVGYLSVSFAFGLLAAKHGLTVMEAVFISMFNLTSAGQIAALPIISGAGSLMQMALTQLVINMRYALMSVTLSQRLGKSVRFCDRFLIGFANTDEVFAVACGKNEPLGRKYLLSLIWVPYLSWMLGTLLGRVAGDILPQIVSDALSVAMYGMFIAIIVPVTKKFIATALCVATSIAISCVLAFVPAFSGISSGFSVIICAVVASIMWALIAPIREGGVDDVQDS